MEAFISGIKSKYCDNTISSDCDCGVCQQPLCSALVQLQLAGGTEHEGLLSKSGIKHPRISYDNLFKADKQRETAVKRVLVQGSAGMGKTCFCVSISEKWAKGKLFREFELVLFLPLCHEAVILADNLSTLLDVIGNGGTSELLVSTLVEKKGQDVLIVADGLDKLDTSKCQKGSFLHDLLFGNVLGLASVIVTSRSSILLKGKSFDRYVHVLGFSETSIVDYISCYEFGQNRQRGDMLLEEVRHNPLIRSICSVPLTCAIVCHLWHSINEALPSTMTELFNKIIFNVVRHNLSNVEKYHKIISDVTNVDTLPEDLKTSWWCMCQGAFEAIVHENKKAFPELQTVLSGIEAIGLMEYVQKEKYVRVSFLPPSFQEYLAALHVLQQSKNTQLRLLCTLETNELTVFWRVFFENHMKSDDRDVSFIKNAFQISSGLLNASLRSTLCYCAHKANDDTINKEVIKVLSVKKQKSIVTIYFGEPHTTLDCDAVIYVIDKVRDLDCDGVEINFKGCRLQEKLVKQLARVLSIYPNAPQVKGLDLSENNLSDATLAHLFHTAQASFKSIKRINLRNNKLSGDGTSAMVAALGKSCSQSCILWLDLSLNPLSIHGLRVLQGAVASGNLANLEILLLRESLTADANTNIQFFITFAEKLTAHCPRLRQLDLSNNDLGDPKSLAIQDVISKFLLLDKKFHLHLNREYMLEVNDRYVTVMEKSITERGTIDHTVVHGVIIGPGRSGKNSLMKRLIGEMADIVSPSTGVLESVIKVEVIKKFKVGSAEADLIWKKLKYSEEALELMMRTVKNHSLSSVANIPQADLRSMNVQRNVSSTVVMVNSVSQSLSTTLQPDSIASSKVSKGSCISLNRIEEAVNEVRTPRSTISLKHEGPLDILKSAIELRHMDGLRDHLESSWSLYLTNTGGQSEFQELLPCLICGPSLFIITFPLDQDLHKHYTEYYQFSDGTLGPHKHKKSPSTLMNEILQTLATIAALDCTGPQLDKEMKPFIGAHKARLKPKVLLVGTHKDRLSDLSEIEKIDRQIRNKIGLTCLYRGSIEFAVPGKQLIFAVNNLGNDDTDFKKIRSTIQRLVERSEEFTIKCPSTWLVFSLVLRAKYMSHQVLSYKDCYIIAQLCGISNREELNVALSFIHYRLGLIRYFCVEGLNTHVVIDPQIFFNAITELMIETFIKDHAEYFEIEDFHKKGIFSMKAIERIIKKKSESDCSTSKLNLKWLLNLLDHLKITTSFKQDDEEEEKYFFPSLLCHAPEQQLNRYPVSCSIKLPPPLLIAFKTGFCPRGIAGVLTKHLMTNDMKPWKLRLSRIYRNQVSFHVGPCDVVIKILPTHLQVDFDPESEPSDTKEVALTCVEAYVQLQRAMKNVTESYYECEYYFAFNCERSDCDHRPHPARIDFQYNKLHCEKTEKCNNLQLNCQMWLFTTQGGSINPRLDLVIDVEHEGVSVHLGQIADVMVDWKGRIAEELGLTDADIADIKHDNCSDLKQQKREALKRWKRTLGSDATYSNLSDVFERAGYKNYAAFTKELVTVAKSYRHATSIQEGPSLSSQKPVYPEADSSLPFVTKSARILNLKKKHQDIHIKTEKALVQELVSEEESSGKQHRQASTASKILETPEQEIQVRDSGTSENDSFVPGTDTLQVEGAMLSRSPYNGDASQDEGATLSRSPYHSDTSQDEGAMLSRSPYNGDMSQDEGATLSRPPYHGDTSQDEGAMLSRSPYHGDTSQDEGAMLSRPPYHGDTSQDEGAMLSRPPYHSDTSQDVGAMLSRSPYHGDTSQDEGAMLSRPPYHGNTSQDVGAMLSRSPYHGGTSQDEGAMLSRSPYHGDTQDQDEGAMPLTNEEYGQEQEVNIVFQSSDTGSDAASVEQESLLFNPEADLQGEVIQVTLKKSPQGFGLTIFGGDHPGELIQIKNIVRGSVADLDGRLLAGDVLVRINGISVLNYNHCELVDLFQSIKNGSEVQIEVRRVPSRQMQQGSSESNQGHTFRELLPPRQDFVRERIVVEITKGQIGFGFFLKQSQIGPIISKITDHSRCAQLKEGDALIEVNEVNVYSYSHNWLVSALQRYPKGSQATFVVFRHPIEPIHMEMPSGSDKRFHILDVCLIRQVSGFGFRIIGGLDRGLPVTIGAIIAGGAADVDGRLTVGDEITHINGRSVVNASYRDAIGLMRMAAVQGVIVLRVRRIMSQPESMSLPSTNYPNREEQFPLRAINDTVSDDKEIRQIEIRRIEGEMFGFHIAGGAKYNSSILVVRIVGGMAADRDGRLRVGDELLEINGNSTAGMLHYDANTIIKNGGYVVKLTIKRLSAFPGSS